MKTIFEIWVLFGIFAFLCIFITTYVAYMWAHFFRGLPPVRFGDHIFSLAHEIGVKRLPLLLAGCLILGPFAFVKTNLDAIDTINEIIDDFEDRKD